MKRMFSRGGNQARVGLVIDADAVRAVALERSGNTITVTRAGEVPLAPGAVSGGEITDVAHVAEALRELWRVGEFEHKTVHLAIGSPRVAIRPVDVPKIADDELRSALKFQIGEHLPINADDAIVDFQALGAPDPERDTRPVLLVAAHRDIVNAAVDAATQAGLRTRRVDVIPLLLARVATPLLASARAAEGDPEGAPPVPGLEAIVDVGEDVTHVVLVYGGQAVFARTLGAGLGRDVVGADADATMLADRLFPLMEEVRNTLAFAASQLRAGKVTALLTSVPAAQEKLLVDCLRATVGVPVAPLRTVELLAAYGGASPYNLDRPFLAATALGLPAALPPGIHAPSLLPEIFDAAAARRRQQLLLAGGVTAIALGLGTMSYLKAGDVSDLKAAAVASNAQEATLRTRLVELEPVIAQASSLQSRQDQLKLAVAGSIDYPQLLNEIAVKLPPDAAARSINLSRQTITVTVEADTDTAPTELLDAADAAGSRLDGAWISAIELVPVPGQPSGSTFSLQATPAPEAAAVRLPSYGVTE
jgi:type IV pilus assembly protein PilM